MALPLLVRSFSLLLIPTGLLVAQSQTSTKRPLNHQDYDSWRTISSQQLSRDGKWLGYAYMPQDGDGDFIVRNLSSGKEYKFPAGALPPPPVIIPGEANPEVEPPRRNLTIRFTSDGLYAAANYFPAKAETEKARKERKSADQTPKGGMILVKLEDGSSTRVGDIKAFQIPEKGGAWIAMHKEGPAGAAAPVAAVAPPGDFDEFGGDQQRRGGGGGAGAGGRAAQFGSDLILRNLQMGEAADRVLPNVTEYSFARDGKVLVYAVGSRKDDENGVFAVTPGNAGAAPVAIAAGKGRYAKVAWDREQTQLAFVTSKDAATVRPAKFAVYAWDRAAGGEAKLVVANQVAGMPQGMSIVDRGAVGFSRDGKKLYVPVGRSGRDALPEGGAPAAPVASADDPKVTMDLWHWKDDFVQPMQRIRANIERARTYRGVYHIAEQKFVQVADEAIQDIIPSDDGRFAIGGDTRAYRRMIDYDGTYADFFVVDTSSGAKKLIAKQLRGGGGGFGGGGPIQWAPDGQHALYYSKGNWNLVRISDGTSRNVTEALGVSFADEEDDTPDPAGSYGTAGWSKDSKSVVVYDRYDLWQIYTDGSTAARNLTNGRGRREKMQFRVQRMDPVDEDDDERGLDLSKPLTLRAASEDTRASGFFRLNKASFEQLVWGPKSYGVAGRAKDADVVLITSSRFDEFPDLHGTDSNFANPRKVTNGGSQLASIRWGTAETVRFRNTDGVALKATLFKPEGFDPSRKYPMMIYIYEKLSQGLHNFVNPTPGTSINIAYYVSNGYLVLTPDIVYTKGFPGQSALKCVLPAIDAVVEKGFVKESAIGIQGHSWGGYQIAYMVTQTGRFKAAEAGAPVGNMTSAYSGIRWGSGMPRQFQYEQTQSRIGTPLYQNPQRYLENSPVFYADRVKTPLLILHNDQDDAVPWYQGIELYLALRRNEKEAYLMNYNGEFHGLRRRHNQKDWTIRMQQFFDYHLRDAAKPEWMEKGVPFLDREEEKERLQKSTDSNSGVK
jgi:dipeptidyl aminopeptidase/acylaminoacyl peptidase